MQLKTHAGKSFAGLGAHKVARVHANADLFALMPQTEKVN